MSQVIPNLDLLRSHLSEEGKEEFEQLVSVLEDCAQSFALVIVRSDFDTETRDALLERLRSEISPVALHTVALSREDFDVPQLLAQVQNEINSTTIIAIVGLEETPQISLESEGEVARPPAVAILNHGREAIRRIGRPMLLWCEPLSYAALRENAPDFFDHYTAIFSFLDAAPPSMEAFAARTPPLLDSDVMSGGRPRLLSAISPRAISPAAQPFYEDQLKTLTKPTLDRARALVGLANALFSNPFDKMTIAQLERVVAILHEALEIFVKANNVAEIARVHGMLAMSLRRILEKQGVANPLADPEVQSHIASALAVFSREEFPIEWASLMWMQGSDSLKEEKDEGSLRHALSYFQSAQSVYTQQKYPLFWASCEMNKGNIYQKLPFTRSNHKRAVAHFEAAAHIFQKLDQPKEWALTQMLLGQAISVAAKEAHDKHERAKLQRRALECYARSQHVYEQIHETNAAALLLTLQALLWSQIPTGNRRQHLRQSADTWLRVGEVLGGSDLPQTALSLSAAGGELVELGKLTRRSNEFLEARQAYEASRVAFEQLGDYDAAKRSAEIIQSIDSMLNKQT